MESENWENWKLMPLSKPCWEDWYERSDIRPTDWWEHCCGINSVFDSQTSRQRQISLIHNAALHELRGAIHDTKQPNSVLQTSLLAIEWQNIQVVQPTSSSTSMGTMDLYTAYTFMKRLACMTRFRAHQIRCIYVHWASLIDYHSNRLALWNSVPSIELQVAVLRYFYWKDMIEAAVDIMIREWENNWDERWSRNMWANRQRTQSQSVHLIRKWPSKHRKPSKTMARMIIKEPNDLMPRDFRSPANSEHWRWKACH